MALSVVVGDSPAAGLAGSPRRGETSDTSARPRHSTLERSSTALIAVGLVAAGLFLYLFVFTNLEAERNQRTLISAFQSPAGRAALSGHVPREGQPAAILEIPAIGLREAVVAGTSAADLESGPGLMPDTAFPGTVGNAVIAGHRTTWGHPFGHLGALRPGDTVTVVTGNGTFHYRISAVGSALSGSRDPISPSSTAELTLVTSNPAYVPTGRLDVRAVLFGRRPLATNARTLALTRPPASERGLEGDAGDLPAVIVSALLLALAVAAMLAVFRRFNAWSVQLLSTPVVLAASVLFFSYVSRLLPPTL